MQHVAVMQPYLFPYLGYYQLAHHVEQFVFFDNVNYIKRGYINRNSILLNGTAHRFTLPVKDVSQNRTIDDHWFLPGSAGIPELLTQAYREAPYFQDVFPWVHDLLEGSERKVSVLAARSVESVFAYLDVPKNFFFASQISLDQSLKAQDKILAVCKALGAMRYTNALGGRELYDASVFKEQGIRLEFINMNPVNYRQATETFVANLSILDVLMWCSRDDIIALLENYSLIDGADDPCAR